MNILATFVGENADGFVSLWGYRFETGAEMVVEDAQAIGKIRGNSEFEWRAVDPLDHDLDGRKGGSLKGELATASKARPILTVKKEEAGSRPTPG